MSVRRTPILSWSIYKFTGKERDDESGLDDFGARYYGSNIGRFITPDWSEEPDTAPYANLGDPQSFNLYSYARNNPLSNEDLDGHACVSGEDGKFHDDNNGGESCADVDYADKNIPASATVNANTQTLRSHLFANWLNKMG